jgi:hypothetical protein
LLEIGEAVKALPAEMHSVLQATVSKDLPEPERAVQALTAAWPAEYQQDEDPPKR